MLTSEQRRRSGRNLRLRAVCTAVLFVAASVLSGPSLAQPQRPELSIELVDPKLLRVCADPHNMSFSTETGEGFENKLAELFASQLGEALPIPGTRKRRVSFATRCAPLSATC